MKYLKKLFSGILFFMFFGIFLSFSPPTYKIAKMKYNGGGDWYANRTALPNLISFCNKNIATNFDKEEAIVEAGSIDIFNYPFIYLTGHGNIVFSDVEALNIRKYLTGGGFLHIDDNYGLKPFITLQMKKVFPNSEFIELPFSHPIYHQTFDFNNGLPKIHQHDGKSPQGFGLMHNNKLVCFFSYESDLGNGWEDQSVHNNPEPIRQQALKMGANIIQYAFNR